MCLAVRTVGNVSVRLSVGGGDPGCWSPPDLARTCGQQLAIWLETARNDRSSNRLGFGLSEHKAAVLQMTHS